MVRMIGFDADGTRTVETVTMTLADAKATARRRATMGGYVIVMERIGKRWHVAYDTRHGY